MVVFFLKIMKKNVPKRESTHAYTELSLKQKRELRYHRISKIYKKEKMLNYLYEIFQNIIY